MQSHRRLGVATQAVVVLVALCLFMLAGTGARAASFNRGLAQAKPAHSSSKNKGKKGSNGSCPNAADCKLATVADIDALKAYLQPNGCSLYSTFTVPDRGFADCPASPECDGFSGYCGGSANVAYASIACPPEYNSLLGMDCFADAFDADGNYLRGLPLLSVDSVLYVANCEFDTSVVPPGSIVDVSISANCFMKVALDGNAAKPKVSISSIAEDKVKAHYERILGPGHDVPQP